MPPHQFYKLDLGTRHDTVSIDRLKPAFLEEASNENEPRRHAQAAEAKPPPHHGNTEVVPVVTSSGRLVRLPARYRPD